MTQITAQDLVRREVYYCVSSLVHTLAQAAGNFTAYSDCRPPECGVSELTVLAEQAFELSCPVLDYEEAAREAGWEEIAPDNWSKPADDDSGIDPEFNTAEECCDFDGIEPYDREVYEHWIVSDWLADALAEKGEKVDKDFAGMTVWARTTTGQAIYMDHVIEQITEDLNRE